MQSLRFNLHYLSNFTRCDLGSYLLEKEDIDVNSIFNYVSSIIDTNERLKDIAQCSPRLRIKENDVYLNLTQEVIDKAIVSDQPLNLIFFNVIAPYCAYQVTSPIQGVSIYFHTDERQHSPHIHASYAGKKVSIELKPPFKVLGQMKKPKLDIALNYIEQNLSTLLEIWQTKLIVDPQYK